jgi:hypothetical protein
LGGAALLVTGMTLLTSGARGEIVLPMGASQGLSGMMSGGAGMAFIGIPLLSAGPYTTKQLLRTIKGAEKVPRTVANEQAYWDAYLRRQYAQAITVSGGGSILLGVLTLAAVGALVGTELYKPEYWLSSIGPFAGGAALLASGIAATKDADARMEAVRNAVDPMRQPAPGLAP